VIEWYASGIQPPRPMASAGSRTRRRRALTDWPRSWLLPPILHPSAWHNHLAQPVADDAPATVAVGQLDALVVVLDLVRTGAACTRPGRARRSDFDRTVVTQRVQQLLDSGLLEEGALAPSTGGRAPRELRFCADAGHLLRAEVGATSVEVAVTNLNGALLHRQRGDGDVTRGPDYGLGQVEVVFDAALAARPAGAPPIWGFGVSVPGPVEFATGQPVAPPIMPDWDRYPIRKRVAQRFWVPVWVDTTSTSWHSASCAPASPAASRTCSTSRSVRRSALAWYPGLPPIPTARDGDVTWAYEARPHTPGRSPTTGFHPAAVGRGKGGPQAHPEGTQRPSGDPLRPEPSAGCGAVSSPQRTARMGPRIPPSESAHSPQSPQKVRQSANLDRRGPAALNH
jgi:hypothetical protein